MTDTFTLSTTAKHRFASAADGLDAARAFESATLDELEYDVRYSEAGDSAGFTVDVFAAGRRSDFLGCLIPVAA